VQTETEVRNERKHPIKNDHDYVRNARCVHTKNKERWYCRDREFQHPLLLSPYHTSFPATSLKRNRSAWRSSMVPALSLGKQPSKRRTSLLPPLPPTVALPVTLKSKSFTGKAAEWAVKKQKQHHQVSHRAMMSIEAVLDTA